MTIQTHVFVIVLIAVGIQAEAAEPTKTDFGTVKGRIIVEGALPELTPLLTKKVGNCGKNSIPDESVTGSNGGLANVFVYLKRRPDINVPKADRATAIDLKECAFQPHAAVFRVGQSVTLKNADKQPYAVKLVGTNNRFNTVIAPGAKANHVFELSERIPARMGCDIHPWMSMLCLPIDHPWGTITNIDGTFEIKDIPAGTRDFVIWHEKLGFIRRSLSLDIPADRKSTTVNITVSADALAGASTNRHDPKIRDDVRANEVEFLNGTRDTNAFSSVEISRTQAKLQGDILTGGTLAIEMGRSTNRWRSLESTEMAPGKCTVELHVTIKKLQTHHVPSLSVKITRSDGSSQFLTVPLTNDEQIVRGGFLFRKHPTSENDSATAKLHKANRIVFGDYVNEEGKMIPLSIVAYPEEQQASQTKSSEIRKPAGIQPIIVTFGEDKKPLANTNLIVRRVDSEWSEVESLKVLTDDQGQALLPVAKGKHNYEFDSEETLPYVRKFVGISLNPNEPLRVNLSQPCQLVLRAVDSQTGEGIAGVEFYRERPLAEYWDQPIYSDGFGATLRPMPKNPWPKGDELKTDKDGYFRAYVAHWYPWIYGTSDYPDTYERLGGEAVELPTSPGTTVTHTFKLRKKSQRLLKEATGWVIAWDVRHDGHRRGRDSLEAKMRVFPDGRVVISYDQNNDSTVANFGKKWVIDLINKLKANAVKRDVNKFLRLEDKNNAPNAISAEDYKTFLSIATKMADPLPSTLWDSSAQRIEIHDGDEIFDATSVHSLKDQSDDSFKALPGFVSDPAKAFALLQQVHWKTLVGGPAKFEEMLEYANEAIQVKFPKTPIRLSIDHLHATIRDQNGDRRAAFYFSADQQVFSYPHGQISIVFPVEGKPYVSSAMYYRGEDDDVRWGRDAAKRWPEARIKVD